MFVDIVKVFIS